MTDRRVYLALQGGEGPARLRPLPGSLWGEQINDVRWFDFRTGVWPLDCFIVDTPRQALESAIAIADLDYDEDAEPVRGAPAEWYEPEQGIGSIDRLLGFRGRRAAAVEPARADLVALRAELERARLEGARFHFVEPCAKAAEQGDEADTP